MPSRLGYVVSMPRVSRILIEFGSEFHRWVRDHEEDLGLLASDDFTRFVERDFRFL